MPEARQEALVLGIDIVNLVEKGVRMRPPDGIVYSTDPWSRLAEDGHTYVTKGPAAGSCRRVTLSQTQAARIPKSHTGRDDRRSRAAKNASMRIP
jgi:hypothetical protein